MSQVMGLRFFRHGTLNCTSKYGGPMGQSVEYRARWCATGALDSNWTMTIHLWPQTQLGTYVIYVISNQRMHSSAYFYDCPSADIQKALPRIPLATADILLLSFASAGGRKGASRWMRNSRCYSARNASMWTRDESVERSWKATRYQVWGCFSERRIRKEIELKQLFTST